MASHNEYPGYVKLPRKKLYHETIRLDFNPHIRSDPDATKLEGFSLRLFVLAKKFRDQQPEMSVTLSAEQWLDLVDEMKREFEFAQSAR
ncbi:MAG TPA: hypothetical protein VIK52_09135, partial [Opitutaceae bacterium]